VRAASTPSAAAATRTLRTPWGDPDLQGLWTSETSTPFERPDRFAGKQFLTAAEVAALEADARTNQQTERRPEDGDPGTYNQFWFDRGTRWVPDRRTSLIIDPPDGRIPWKPGARTTIGGTLRVGPFDSYTDLDTGERCLTDGPTLVPMQSYNMNFKILQAPGYVVIAHEMFHNRQIIPLDGRQTPSVPQWFGMSRGRWEGDTLVVETTSFADKRRYRWAQGWRAARPTLRVTERFTRLDAKTIDYQFTIEDPQMFTRPWTAKIPLSQDRAAVGVTEESRQYEYACHEGNYSIVNVLSGARAAEKQKGSR
jgi:hypothetical protein